MRDLIVASRGRSWAMGAFLLAGLGCAAAEGRRGPLESEPFKDYWFSGKAELTRYELEQARYGEIHRGDAVLIFVTEDFLPDRQVKADSTDRSGTRALPVLKLNLTKRFDTGLYPYSIMTSVFTPLDLGSNPRTLKVSSSAQEWCGHTYLQLNLRDGGYRADTHSYFESEADRSFRLEPAWLEDEIWTRIRLAPESLPTGSVRIIPGGEQSRLRHRGLAVETAGASLERAAGGVLTYSLEYPASRRSLVIRFREAFPHEILGWEETDPGGRGPGGAPLTTRAARTHSLRIDYWNRNTNADRPLQRELGLD